MKHLLKPIFKKIIITALIIFSVTTSFVTYLLATKSGAKFLLTNCIKYLTFDKNSKNIIAINKVFGSFIKGLTLQNIIYLKPNNELIVKNVEIELNFKELFKNRRLTVVVKNLSGTFNTHPILSYLDFNIRLQKKNYKRNINIQLNKPNFIKVGNNIIELTPQPNDSNIKFILTANELEIFYPQAQGLLKIDGKIANDLQNFSANVLISKLILNGKTYFGELLTKKNNHISIEVNKKSTGEIVSNLFIDFEDLTSIGDCLPSLSRLKGHLKGNVTFYLTNDIEISSNLSLQNITVFLPEYGVKIKPLNINFTANKEHKVTLTGKGIMRNGPGEFTLNGYFEPFDKNFNNLLEIKTTELEFINTKEYHLIGTATLKLNFLLQQQILNIVGNTCVTKGIINLDQQAGYKVIKSKDIVFTDPDIINNLNPSSELSVVPDVSLRIDPDTKLIGKGLNTNISGKLRIYALEDNSTIVGDGRISIKKGTYTLSGQEFNIEKGRIIYLPRTIISNPNLDIKITQVDSKNVNNSKEKYLYVEGTLENPIVKDSGLINEHQAILQLLNFTNDKVTSNIKKKLHLHEFGIQETEDNSKQFKNKPAEESLLGSKNFVIGKKIKSDLYLQYLKTLNSTNNTLRLKYKLNKNWALGLETSTEDGHGADVRFSIEK